MTFVGVDILSLQSSDLKNKSSNADDVLKSNKLWLTVEGAASSIYLILTQGALFTAIALYFELNPFWLSVTAAFPLVFQVFQLIAPQIIKHFGNRPRLMIVFNACRFIWFVPLIFAYAGIRSPVFFIIVFALSQLANAFAGNVWVGLSRDLIPDEERGRFLGRRNIAVSATTIIATFMYTTMLDVLAKPLSILLTIGFGMLASVVSILTTLPIRDNELSLQASASKDEANRAGFNFKTLVPSIIKTNRALLENKNLARFIVAMMVWNFFLQITSPFFAYHQITNLSLSMRLIGITSIITSVLSIMFFRIWGILGDKLGHKSVLVLGVSIASVIPILWFFMEAPLWPYILAVDIVLTAVGWSAVNLAILTFGMEISGKESSAGFALINAGAGIAGLLGSLVGGVLGQVLKPINVSLAGLTVNGIQFLFLGGGLLRFIGLAFFKKVSSDLCVEPKVLFMNVLSVIARRFAIRPVEMDE